MEDIKNALNLLSTGVEEVPCHWFSSAYTDAAINYCRPCANKRQAKHPDADPGDLMIDGGYPTDHDSRPYCDKCDARLIGYLTDYGVQEEVRHFTDDRDGRMKPEVAADLLDIIDEAQQALLEKVRASLGPPTTEKSRLTRGK